jgi:hypothetical protein
LLVLAVASPAFAQRAEVSGVLGYSFSEGINFNAADAEGWWCDPYYGCGVVGTYKYSHQFELAGGIVARF